VVVVAEEVEAVVAVPAMDPAAEGVPVVAAAPAMVRVGAVAAVPAMGRAGVVAVDGVTIAAMAGAAMADT
jgi:hypothetical protein